MVFVVCGLIGFGARSASAGERTSLAFENAWISPSADFNTYKEVFIHSVDLRDLVLKIWDEEEDEAVRRHLDEKILEAIGHRLYNIFAENLRFVMTVNDGEMGAADIPALVIDVRLKAEIPAEEDRLLMRTVNQSLGKQGQPFALIFECDVSDKDSGEKIITLSDKQEFVSESPSVPFSTSGDMDALSATLSTWALRLADLLGKYRTGS